MILAGTLSSECGMGAAETRGFVFFPLVVHALDLVVSTVGVLSVTDKGPSKLSDPLGVLKRGYLVALGCSVLGFFFATRKIRTQSEDAGFNRKRTIAHAIGKDGGERILRTVGGPSCVAKNRYGITEELPLEWAAFVQAMSSHQ